VADLERELRALAAAVELPEPPELSARVRAGLGRHEPRPRRRPILAFAVALLAVAIGAAFAVPQSRSALLRLFGLKGVTVLRVDRLPPVGPGPVVFGEKTTLAAAARIVGFRPLLPKLGKPDAVYLERPAYLVLLYGKPVRLRFSELRPGYSPIEKFAKVSQEVRPVTVDGRPGLWIPGNHVVIEFGNQPRLAGSTLLWEHGDLTLRVEGKLTLAQALEIARSVP